MEETCINTELCNTNGYNTKFVLEIKALFLLFFFFNEGNG